MKIKFEDNTDYRSFAKDMIKLCKKYNIKIRACDEGAVLLGTASAKIIKDFMFYEFSFDSERAFLSGKEEIEIKL